ncbi:MAG: choice-of-anchor D domain-containing protein [Myxococcaceae bacterium]
MRALPLFLAFAVVAGCKCDTQTSKRFPKIEVLDDMGNSRTSVDFGQVQLHFKAVKRVRIRNDGTAALTIDKASFTNALYAVDMPLPVSIGVSEELMFPLAFTPEVADQRVTASVTLSTDDPNNTMVSIDLAGTGVTATAVVQPTQLDFGQVYVGESKDLTFALTNSGSNELPVTSATLTMVPGVVTSDLTPLVKTLQGGETVMVTVHFAPTAQVSLMGSLELVLPNGVGNKSIPIRGTGIQAVPKICFKFDDSPMESCTDGTGGLALDVRFGALCDARVYPADGGFPCTLDGGVMPYERSGKFYVRNEGNTPIQYSMQIQAGQPNRCDGGASIDFAWANAPDAGAASFNVPTFKLPTADTDPKPWETAPVAVVFRPRSICRNDASDLSTVLWRRQNEPTGTMRLPGSLTATLSGASLLSNPQPNMVTFTGNNPAPQDVTLVSNTGDGPVKLLTAELFQSADGGTVPDQACSTATVGPCTWFKWATGPALPVTLEGTITPGARISQVVGQIEYGLLDAGVRYVPSQPQTVFAIVGTSDPYTPQVVVPIIGRLN